GFNLASSRSNSFVRSSRGMGMVKVISTISSPRAPSFVADGTPFSRSRSFCPGCVPGGIFSRALPSMVGTSIFAPRAASLTVTGTVRANVLPRDIQAQDTAANGGPERNVDLVFQVASGLGAYLRGSPRALAATEDRSEDVAEASTTAAPAPAVRTVDQVREIAPAE